MVFVLHSLDVATQKPKGTSVRSNKGGILGVLYPKYPPVFPLAAGAGGQRQEYPENYWVFSFYFDRRLRRRARGSAAVPSAAGGRLALIHSKQFSSLPIITSAAMMPSLIL